MNEDEIDANGVSLDGKTFVMYHGDYLATEFSVPQGVTAIAPEAFYDCNSLTTVILPEGLTSIGERAFWGCSSLTSIVLPKSVTSIGENAFSGCNALAAFEVVENGDAYCSIDGVLFTKDKKTLIRYPEGKREKEYAVPDGVTAIGDEAFRGSQLNSLILPDSVTAIGVGAFLGSSLTSLVLPSGVAALSGYALTNCSSLTSVVLPDGLTSIGKLAFWECSSLKTLVLPASVTAIERGAFDGCASLTSIEVAKDAVAYGSVDGVLFTKDGKTLVRYPEGKREKNTPFPTA
ncbi:MAG: leucine-rich repeat domain-containing protein [Thermoguttaceae bacterium]|nr:leucine-rich repeat domain-containing protein [Thermoguttaceae bacterium]